MLNNIKTKIQTGSLIVVSIVFLLYLSGNLNGLFSPSYDNKYCGYTCNGNTCSIYNEIKSEFIKKNDSFISKPFLSINNYEYKNISCKNIQYKCKNKVYESLVSKNKYKCIVK